MSTLHAENRNARLKPKQLRREGFIPGVLYGKNLKESLSIQFPQAVVAQFLGSNSVGSKVELTVGDKKFSALLREVSRRPVTGKPEHLSFQALLADEIVTSTMTVILVNGERVDGMVQQPQSEISYRALPSNLVDKIEIDISGLQAGESMRISDLDIAKNPDIEVLTPLDAMVVSVVETRRIEEPETAEEIEGESDEIAT